MRTYKDKVRAICHALKMSSLSGIDPDKTIDISSRIRSLPSPEKIASMEHGDTIELSSRVERLIFDMGNSRNSRTVGYALRHKIDKGLPPRMAPVLAATPVQNGAGNWLTRAAEDQGIVDYSRMLHPEWKVVKTDQKVGDSRVFRLMFEGKPMEDFILTRYGNGRYDGGTKPVKRYPVLHWFKQKNVRPPMTMEVFSKAMALIDPKSKSPSEWTEEDYHNAMQDIEDGKPDPVEE